METIQTRVSGIVQDIEIVSDELSVVTINPLDSETGIRRIPIYNSHFYNNLSENLTNFNQNVMVSQGFERSQILEIGKNYTNVPSLSLEEVKRIQRENSEALRRLKITEIG